MDTKFNTSDDTGYSAPTAIVQHMLDVTVFIEVQLEPESDANGYLPFFNRRGGSGGGVIINAKAGIILTNNHVISDVERKRDFIYVKTNDGALYVCGKDDITLYPKYDLALINIGLPFNTSAVLTESVPGAGESILVVGSPQGETNINSISGGVLSHALRKLEGAEDLYFVQTDAAINPGSSGGPWFDKDGRVFAISAMVDINAQNLGYGIPMKYLREATGK